MSDEVVQALQVKLLKQKRQFDKLEAKYNSIIENQILYSSPKTTDEDGVYTKKLAHNIHYYQLQVLDVENNKRKKVRYSFIVPARGHPKELKKSFDSLVNLVSDKECFEIILRRDEDDESLKNFEYDFDNLTILTGPRLRGYSSLHLFYTQCSEYACGDYLFLWNDDVFMSSKDWDVKLDKAVSTLKHKGVFAIKNSTVPWAFPMVDRRWVKTLGSFSRISYTDWWNMKLCEKIGHPMVEINTVELLHSPEPERASDPTTFELLFKTQLLDPLLDLDAKVLKENYLPLFD